ncbi:MAG: metal-dependent hydrolase [Candidatus Woesearchaeota archaeon]|jgi:membrane-bound metal-dependent hydrolase YbcI (DUF457 family)|nr:metal-dependent hydrolase [Candidatus Woesearchaeota archaeon]
MPQAVVHVLFTIIVIDLFRDYVIKNKRSIPLLFVFIGGVAGLLPDADIPVYWLFKNILGIQVEWFHRTITHSLFFPLMFLAIALIFLSVSKKYFILFAIISFGTGFHIFLDYVFSGYIMPFYPFSTATYGLDLFTKTGFVAIANGVDAIVLLLWLWHEEVRHKISDFI